MLAGGDPEKWPDYEGSEEEQDNERLIEQIEAELMASPFVHHVGYSDTPS